MMKFISSFIFRMFSVDRRCAIEVADGPVSVSCKILDPSRKGFKT